MLEHSFASERGSNGEWTPYDEAAGEVCKTLSVTFPEAVGSSADGPCKASSVNIRDGIAAVSLSRSLWDFR